MTKQPNTHPLTASCFFRLPSPHKLAALLQITLAELGVLTTNAHRLYREWDEPKPKGGKRHIESPAPGLKRAQKRVADLLARVRLPDHLFCPVKRRSYVTNAAQHAGRRVICGLDIKSYFENTKSTRVYWFFHTVMQCAPDVAAMLTKLSTLNGHLPTGSPLSPIMAYLAHIDVWQSAAAIAERHGCTVTVYIDDLTISGSRVPEAMLWEIKRVLHGGGLRYHKEKRAIDCPVEITGVIIDGNRLRVPRRQHRKLHVANQDRRKPENADMNAIVGRIAGLKGQMQQIRIVDASPATRRRAG